MNVRRDERGETLIEVMLTIMIMGTGLVAVVAALGSLIIGSDTHRNLAEGEIVLRAYGEQIKTHAIESTVSPADVPCPDADDLDPTPGTDVVDDAIAGPGWTAEITTVWYWIPDALSFPNGTWSAANDASGCNSFFTDCGLDEAVCTTGLQRVEFVVENDRSDYAHAQVTGRVIVRRNNAE